jgi:hypothetical protein
MDKKRIMRYALGWYPGSNRARAQVWLEDGTRHELPVESAQELAVLAAILRESAVYVFADGMIGTDWEQPGSEDSTTYGRPN